MNEQGQPAEQLKNIEGAMANIVSAEFLLLIADASSSEKNNKANDKVKPTKKYILKIDRKMLFASPSVDLAHKIDTALGIPALPII